jgi:hypothetical protein
VRSEINEGATFIFSMKLEDEAEFFKNNIVVEFDTESDADEQIIDKVERPKIRKANVNDS